MLNRFRKNRWVIELILAVWLVGLTGFRFTRGALEQDDYWRYGQSLLQGSAGALETSDTRLFPGLPVVLAVAGYLRLSQVQAGILVVLGSYAASRWLLWLVTGKRWSGIALWFPPVVLDQMSQVSSEAMLVWSLLAGVLFFKRKQYLLAGLVLGLAGWFRLIGLGGFAAAAAVLLWQRRWRAAVQISLGTILMVGLLWVFNAVILGTNDPLWQLRVYREVGRSTWAVPQLAADMLRAWDWGWYRNAAAGAGYLAILALMVRAAGKRFQDSETGKMVAASAGVMGAFVFSIGPTPFLEEFPRFLVPVYLFLWLLILEPRQVPVPVYLAAAAVSSLVVLV